MGICHPVMGDVITVLLHLGLNTCSRPRSSSVGLLLTLRCLHAQRCRQTTLPAASMQLFSVYYRVFLRFSYTTNVLGMDSFAYY